MKKSTCMIREKGCACTWQMHTPTQLLTYCLYTKRCSQVTPGRRKTMAMMSSFEFSMDKKKKRKKKRKKSISSPSR